LRVQVTVSIRRVWVLLQRKKERKKDYVNKVNPVCCTGYVQE